jgi:tetratricopeptide (TPR) repeat protein
MDLFKNLIREAHRRSLWQVLSVYLVGSWIALQVVEIITESAGLPDWAQPFSLVLLIIGLPVVLATAVVQEGVTGREARTNLASGETAEGSGPQNEAGDPQSGSERQIAEAGLHGGTSPWKRHRLFTWRNAVAGGVAAFALLGILVAGYFVLWSAGIGPVGSLAAQGVFDEGDQVVLADFHNATPDPLLGSVVTDALRIDLAESDAITLVESTHVMETLARMQRDPSQELTAELAREIAVRDGIKAILEGDVGAAGTGYILSATMRAAESGETLASFRRTAETPEEVIGAIDKLSQDIREKAGESLLSIKRGAALEQVTTTSLGALRKFSEAAKLSDAGDEAGSVALLAEAIALDSAFAMAHRKMAVNLYNMGIDRDREVEALTAAFRHRERLTERERLITEASYHNGITGDRDAIMRAYEGVLRIAPDDRTALNNLANVYNELEDFDRAGELYERAVNGPGTSNTAHSNLVRTRLLQGDHAGAREALAAFEAAHPQDPNVPERAFWVHAFAGEWAEAEAQVARWEANPELPLVFEVNANEYRAELAMMQGKMGEARRRIRQAQRLAELELGPGTAWFYTLYGAYLEVQVGSVDGARSIVDGLEETGLFEEIPIPARDYPLAVIFQNLVENEEGAFSYLERWEEELPQEFAGRYDDADRALQRSMVGGIGRDPEGVLTAIENYRARLRCSRCNRVQEAQALEAAGRLEEARNVYRHLAETIESNFTVSLTSRPMAWEAVGRLSDQIGDAAGAVEGYGNFVALWADADPELRPRVEAARARMAALEAGPGDSAPSGNGQVG